jgi:hypothetical protein
MVTLSEKELEAQSYEEIAGSVRSICAAMQKVALKVEGLADSLTEATEMLHTIVYDGIDSVAQEALCNAFGKDYWAMVPDDQRKTLIAAWTMGYEARTKAGTTNANLRPQADNDHATPRPRDDDAP